MQFYCNHFSVPELQTFTLLYLTLLRRGLTVTTRGESPHWATMSVVQVHVSEDFFEEGQFCF